MTEEHKEKLRASIQRVKEERALGIRPPYTKKRKKHDKGPIIVYITGEEADAFDFRDPIREAYRKRGLYNVYPPILRKITHMSLWTNPEAVKNILEKYVTLVVRPPEKRKKRTRKVLTNEEE